jgi:uncharacterized protein
MTQPNLYVLAADNPSTLLTLLRVNPSLASGQDEHGYSLLHAAASYGHLDLLRALVHDFKVDVNLTDEDGETCLFVAESLEIAKCLVEELGVDPAIKNDEGLTAQEMIENDGSFPVIAVYLKEDAALAPDAIDLNLKDLHPPPFLPPNVSVNIGTMSETEPNGGLGDIDPEFKRGIDELAARDDFHSEAGQIQLRNLVTDAIRDVGVQTKPKDASRRTD